MTNETDKLIGALNGAFGDLLVKHNNPLAQEMQLNFLGHNIETNPQAKELFNATLESNSSNTVALFIHGLGNTEHIWDFDADSTMTTDESSSAISDNYGSRLMETFAITPLFLRYNTGLPIAENGNALNTALSNLLEAYSQHIEQIILVGFSMGGLIARSAQSWARQNPNSLWLDRLEHAIYIGTPHEGAPLEKLTKHASALIARTPKTYFKVWGEQLNLRSEGVKNLGTQHSEHEALKFTDSCEHYFIAGSIWRSDQKVANWMFGDSLVRRESASPKDRPTHSKTAYFEGIHHLRLAYSNTVWKQLRTWLAEYYPQANSELCTQLKLGKPAMNPELVHGATLALTSASTHIISLTEAIHRSIAAEPFNALNQIPVIGSFTKPVEQLHNVSSSLIYSALKKASESIRSTGKENKKTPS
jgi:pimeloyl-ACP methyl ester carboxylesterase